MKTYLSTWMARIAAVAMAVGGAAVTGYGATTNLYWDVNGAPTGTGGTGPWNLSGSTWSNSATGTFQAWDNGVNGNSAYLAGTPGTLTLETNITVALLSTTVLGYTINGDAGGLYKLTIDSTEVGGSGYAITVPATGAKLLTINAPVVLSGPLMHQFRGDVTINGVVSGAQGFYPGPNVTLTLTNANTFSGGVTLLSSGGTLAIGHDQALGTGVINPGSLATHEALEAVGGNRTISNVIKNSGGGVFALVTSGNYNLTLAGGVGPGSVGGLNPTFAVNGTGTLTINRPLYYNNGAATLTKSGSGPLVLNQSFGNRITENAVNVGNGTLIVNGDAVGQSVQTVNVTSNSAVILGLSSTDGLRVGQLVSATGLTFESTNIAAPVILSIDSPTQVTLGARVTTNITSKSITFNAAGALGYNTGNITVSNAATLGGTGTVVLATGKTNTVLAGGTIAPGGITAGTEVGTLTVTNGTFDFQQNAIYAWQCKNGVGDKVRVYGTLILPTVATVNVTQVSGSMPVDPPIFTATALAGATSLTNWVVTGAPGYSIRTSGGTNVILKASSKGTIIMFK